MRRRLLNLLTALSLLLCVATCVMWVRSLSTLDCWEVNWISPDDAAISCAAVSAERGRLCFSFDRVTDRREDILRLRWEARAPWQYSTQGLPTSASFPRGWLGFHVGRRYHQAPDVTIGRWDTIVPYWALAATFLIPPLRSVYIAGAGSLRVRRGLCRRCGYDLRGTPGRCPECGSVAVGGDAIVNV